MKDNTKLHFVLLHLTCVHVTCIHAVFDITVVPIHLFHTYTQHVAREQVGSGDPIPSKKRKLPSSSGPDEPG